MADLFHAEEHISGYQYASAVASSPKPPFCHHGWNAMHCPNNLTWCRLSSRFLVDEQLHKTDGQPLSCWRTYLRLYLLSPPTSFQTPSCQCHHGWNAMHCPNNLTWCRSSCRFLVDEQVYQTDGWPLSCRRSYQYAPTVASSTKSPFRHNGWNTMCCPDDWTWCWSSCGLWVDKQVYKRDGRPAQFSLIMVPNSLLRKAWRLSITSCICISLVMAASFMTNLLPTCHGHRTFNYSLFTRFCHIYCGYLSYS